MPRRKKEDLEVENVLENDSGFGLSSAYLEKEKRIKTEIARLRKQFKDIPKDKLGLVNSTVESIAFMTIQMQDLQDSIIKNGTTVEYDNGGGQKGTKQSPDAQFYLQFSQKHTQAMKILLDCIPKAQPVKNEGVAENDLLRFVSKR